ncbi:sporulation membrane protein YtaF [Ligaoa zhengdingensis]|uniref:sporulation membrane protein YtaF n=1 Tax=Ligaoa zhengdingensis TaxID=2763658 RepID=UPI00201684D7|nr:sporulation membrane protein YtaF [Ligaoa zhengdingensis]
MHITLLSALEALLLVTALSTDAFVASFAYGTNQIDIPRSSVTVISLICSGILGVALVAGSVLQPFLPAGLTKAVCFSILLILGLVKLFDSSVKSFIRRHKGVRRELSFSVSQLRCILSIYADPEVADWDCSRQLSPGEASSLAVALSLDGLAVGFGAGLGDAGVLEAVFFSLLLGALAVKLGCWLGKKAAKRFQLNLSWLGGAMLIVLAFFKL